MSLFIERDSISSLCETFIKNTKNLVFRRVQHVVLKDNDFLGTSVKKIEGETVKETFIPAEEKVTWSEEEWLKNVELQYAKFHFFTSQARLRENDKTKTSIYGTSNRISEMDLFEDCDFHLKLQIPKKGISPPRVGDLICGLVGQNRFHRNPEYKFWFVCSEQFFRTWTAIHYEEHESLSKKCGNGEAQIKRHLMSGNRLSTNSTLKLILGARQSNVKVDQEEIAKKFFRVRTEPASRYWVHVYSFLVMSIRYLEYPTDVNVPNNLDNTPKMTKWDLPEGWIGKLFAKYGVVKAENDQLPELVEHPREVKAEVVLEKKGETVNVSLLKSVKSSGYRFIRDLNEETRVKPVKKFPDNESEFPYLPQQLPSILCKSSIEKIKKDVVIYDCNPNKLVYPLEEKKVLEQ